MFGNSASYLETPLRRPSFQTPSVPTPSLNFASFTGGRTPGNFATPGGGLLSSSALGVDDNRGEKIAMSHKMLRQKSQGHVVDLLQMQKDAAEGKEADVIQQKTVLENRIRKLNEEAEAHRLQSVRMHKRIEFLEERSAESSSTTSRQVTELTEEIQQLQTALQTQQSVCRDLKRDAEDMKRALDACEAEKKSAEQLLVDANTHLQQRALTVASQESKISNLEELLSVAEEQRDEALERIIKMEQIVKSAQSNSEAVSSDLKASRQSEQQLEARVLALTTSLEKIEAEVGRDTGESNASMAALIEQSRRGGDAIKGLQAVGGEMKRLKQQIADLEGNVADLSAQLHTANAGRERAEAATAASQAREAKSLEKLASVKNDKAQLKLHFRAIEKRVCGHGHAEGEEDHGEDGRCQELERALSAAVVAEGVARSKASHAKQELTRVKAMSAAQILQSQKEAERAKLMLEAIEARLVDHAQEFCSSAALSQAVLCIAPPRPLKKTQRAWAHPGTDIGGVLGDAAAAAEDAVEESPKQKRRSK